MSGAARQEVRGRAIRTALVATLAVGIVYLVISVAVVAFVTSSLTDQIDARLLRALEHPESPPPPVDEPFEPPPGDRPYGPRLLVWGITADGTIYKNDLDNPDLPVESQRVSAPTTATIDGTPMRLVGQPVDVDWIVIGQTLDAVSDARATIVRGELLIAPVLLLAVFLGAFAIGRRVALPIEEARRRQLEFTADASHELRTPLSVIEAHTSLALTHDRDATWYRGAFERVDHEAKRMRHLLEDLLWLARFDATQAPPHAEPVDLGVLAAQAVDRFAAIAESRALRLTLQADRSGVVVAGPPEWLDRLLGVLLDNACKYASDGGSVDVTVAGEGSRVRLTIDDSGPGIRDVERGRIFDRFHRATDGAGGAGLGLAIADAVVRATGGRWQVGSSSAGGASMTVSWPRALPPSGERERVMKPTGEERPAS
jgi:signal transduction histidine kinase